MRRPHGSAVVSISVILVSGSVASSRINICRLSPLPVFLVFIIYTGHASVVVIPFQRLFYLFLLCCEFAAGLAFNVLDYGLR